MERHGQGALLVVLDLAHSLTGGGHPYRKWRGERGEAASIPAVAGCAARLMRGALRWCLGLAIAANSLGDGHTVLGGGRRHGRRR